MNLHEAQQQRYGEVEKSFIGEIDLRYGTKSFVSWERLKPHLEQEIALRKNEQIVGLIAYKEGVSVKVDYIKE